MQGFSIKNRYFLKLLKKTTKCSIIIKLYFNYGGYIVKFTISQKENHAYLLVNDTSAEFAAKSIITEFLLNEDGHFIFICYHVKDDIILLHFKTLKDEDFNSAIKLIKEDILSGGLCADDKKLKLALKDPQASTAKFLLDFITSEEE